MKTKEQILEVLGKIERKEIAIEPIDVIPAEVFCGDIRYRVPSLNWEIVVFDDCDEWDYIDHIIDEDGTLYDPWRDGVGELVERSKPEWLCNYRPEDSSAYGI